MKFCIEENNLKMHFLVNETNDLKLLHVGLDEYTDIFDYILPFQSEDFRAAEAQISGQHHDCAHGTKNMGTSEGKTLKYVSHEIKLNEQGKCLKICLSNDNILLEQYYQFYNKCHVIKAYSNVKNISNKELPLEYVSSFFLYGLGKKNKVSAYEDLELNVSVNASYRENQWRSYELKDLGFVPSSKWSTTCQKICYFNTGSWSSKERLPMAFIREKSTNQHILWQIENNGSWSYEIGDYNSCLYLGISGPNFTENQWQHVLKPNETFLSVSAALAFSLKDENDMFGQMTIYRRSVRKKHADNEILNIVYNPYMHDSCESPTEERVLQAVEGVKDLDIDYFCLDAGWHDDKVDYWKAIGDWKESKTRFPSGLNKTFDKISEYGMKPGLWLEIEMVGYYNDLLDNIPKDYFFCRKGGIIANLGRMNLDFTNEKVVIRINKILEDIISKYNPKYLKIDYNADVGAGTDVKSDSLGDGLLKHNRAYIEWLNGFMDAHSDITIENCSCGGLRLDGVMLNTCSIHSTSDQTNYLLYPYIAGNMLSNGTPEQMAVWCYPLLGQDNEAVIMNMVNSLLGRIHLSGHTPYLEKENKDLIKEGLSYHRKIADDKKNSLPFWPLGLNSFGGDIVACGIYTGKIAYLAVWNLGAERDIILPVTIGKIKNASNGYPKDFKTAKYFVDEKTNSIAMHMIGQQARLVEIQLS